jgi:molecular chaperone DnaJ
VSDRDPYEVLGLSRDADEKTIKKAFRTLGAKHHPDKNPDDPKAADRFKEVNSAYQVLSDPEKRAQFDQWGHGGPAPGGSGGFGGFPFDFNNVQQQINDFFGGSGARRVRKGRDIRAALELEFVDAVYGATRQLRLKLPVLCDPCKGSGAENAEMSKCEACNGMGVCGVRKGSVTFSINCQTCGGAGNRPTAVCSACQGAGKTMRDREFDVTVPPGTITGQRIGFSGMGEPMANGISGDLYLIIQVKNHERFAIDGKHLRTDEFLTFPQAALGTDRKIEFPDGSSVVAKINAGVGTGSHVRLRGKGIPPNGDLIIGIHVETPKDLSDRAVELMTELAKELS